MNMKTNVVIFAGTMSLFLGACSLSSSLSSSSSESPASRVFSAASTAFTSVSNATVMSSTGFSASGTESSVVSGCTTTGEASNGSGTPLATNAASWAKKSVICATKVNSGSPDTFQGSYGLVGGILCSIDKNVSGFSYSASGVEYLNKTVAMTSGSCFSSSFMDAYSASGDDTHYKIHLKAYNISASTDWTYKIEIYFVGSATSSGGLPADVSNPTLSSPDVTIYLVDESGKIGFKLAQSGSGSSLVLDSNTGRLMYENLDSNNDRHARVLIEGTFNSSYSMSSISNIEVIQADGTGSGFKAFSAKGNSGSIKYLAYSGTTPTAETNSTECVTTGCGAGLTLSDTSFTNFAAQTSAVSTFLAQSTAPMSFSSVDVSDFVP